MEKPPEEAAAAQGASDLDMLMGITKHIAGLSDRKGRMSTTLMVAQETLKEKMVIHLMKS